MLRTVVITIAELFTLSVNEFNQPKSFKDAKATALSLTYLLLLNPGTFQTHPDMGVGLVSRYRFSVDATAELRKDYQNQIEKYLPQYQGAKVVVVSESSVFYIAVTIDNTTFTITYDQNKNSVNVGFGNTYGIGLSDL